MNNTKTIKDILKATSNSEDISFLLNRAKDSFADKRFSEYEAFMLSALKKSEKSALAVRNIAFSTISNQLKISAYRNEVSQKVYNVTAEIQENIFKMTLPMLCPHQEDKARQFLFVQPIITAMENLKVKSKLPEYSDKTVIAFVNKVSCERHIKDVRDNDNYEYKQIQNIVAGYLLTDDGAFQCSNFYDTVLAEKDATEVYVIPQNQFVKWYAETAH